MPPNIDDSQSSSDAIVREGSNVSLTCKATGSPIPSIRWKREDGTKIAINKSLSGKNSNISILNNVNYESYLKSTYIYICMLENNSNKMVNINSGILF